MLLTDFIKKLRAGDKISFNETIVIIAENYHYHPTEFTNGLNGDSVVNAAGSNEGSCKIFAFAQLNRLSPAETLSLFGDYYWLDVLEHPEATDHQNIRNFIKYGWAGIQFTGKALSPISS